MPTTEVATREQAISDEVLSLSRDERGALAKEEARKGEDEALDAIGKTQALQRWIKAGELLYSVRQELKYGEWEPWLKAQGITKWRAHNQLRAFLHRDQLGEVQSIYQLRQWLQGRSVPLLNETPSIEQKEVEAVQRLRKEGLLQKEIGQRLGLSKVQVQARLYPGRQSAYAKKSRQKRRAEKQALKEKEAKQAAKKLGGAIGRLYADYERHLRDEFPAARDQLEDADARRLLTEIEAEARRMHQRLVGLLGR